MKHIDLKHKSPSLADKEMKKHGSDCGLDKYKDVYFIKCKCDDVVMKVDKKKVREDIVDEIDTNGNGRLTKKEIKSWINKKDDDK